MDILMDEFWFGAMLHFISILFAIGFGWMLRDLHAYCRFQSRKQRTRAKDYRGESWEARVCRRSVHGYGGQQARSNRD